MLLRSARENSGLGAAFPMLKSGLENSSLFFKANMFRSVGKSIFDEHLTSVGIFNEDDVLYQVLFLSKV